MLGKTAGMMFTDLVGGMSAVAVDLESHCSGGFKSEGKKVP